MNREMASAPNLRQNETIEEKKRKLTLKLNNIEANSNPSTFSMSSNDSTSDFNSININSKKFCPNIYNGNLSVTQSDISRNKDLLSNLDMPTPHLEKLINDFNPNNGVLKTPGLELFTPSIEISFGQFGQKGLTPDGSKNLFHQSQPFMQSDQEKSECQTPNTTLINPLNIFGASNSYVSDNQAQEADNAPKYSNLMPVAQNTFLVQPMSTPVLSSTSNQDSNNQNKQYQNLTTKKDELQTVPIHSNGMLMNQRMPNGKKKQPAPKIKNLSDMSSQSNQSGTCSMKSEPEVNMVGSITDRRNTDRSTSSTGDMFSPVNYENQDDMKLEKKRERNREAARKCRFRKLQKIAELEQKVKSLTDLNNEQKIKNKALVDEINEIKQKLQNHQKTHNCDLKLDLYNT
ncbi:transcription factor AP-1 [Brachionus plicatilis]|uniref:Transcription factor AP-1 n=1 Tax=Brachionus plicatilis TaxID=10195 RepID=A0A3M7RR98_BRAPC|nr:transcription factor AP-1 [Brachionus plicatilis]